MKNRVFVVIGFVVALLSGWLTGETLGVTRWGATTVAALLIGGFLLAVFLFSESQAVHDGQPMPPAQSRFLALYLVTTSVALLYLVFALIGVRFREPSSMRATNVPSLPEALRPTDPKDTKPRIVYLVPDPVVVDTGTVDLQIVGFNLGGAPAQSDPAKPPAPVPAPIVHFAGIRKIPKVFNEQLVIVELSQTDIGAYPGARAVSLRRSDTELDKKDEVTKELTVLDQTGDLRVLRWSRQITREIQLLLLVIVAGALGSYLHAIRSLTTYIGNQQAVASWFWFYITKPFVGMALAVIFYATIRGGFVAGSPADVKAVNPFGVFAIAALVGMFADKAGNKLAEIFDALFTAKATRQNPSSDLALLIKLPGTGQVNQQIAGNLEASGGTKPYTFKVLKAPAWLTTDAAGNMTGTPTVAGKFPVEASVTDSKTTVATKSLTIEIT